MQPNRTPLRAVGWTLRVSESTICESWGKYSGEETSTILGSHMEGGCHLLGVCCDAGIAGPCPILVSPEGQGTLWRDRSWWPGGYGKGTQWLPTLSFCWQMGSCCAHTSSRLRWPAQTQEHIPPPVLMQILAGRGAPKGLLAMLLCHHRTRNWATALTPCCLWAEKWFRTGLRAMPGQEGIMFQLRLANPQRYFAFRRVKWGLWHWSSKAHDCLLLGTDSSLEMSLPCLWDMLLAWNV